jgi:tetratricopeptide (TPR) repeat protein
MLSSNVSVFYSSIKNLGFYFSFSIVCLFSCITPMQKREMNDDIQKLKEHVALLQQSLNEGRSHTQTTGEIHQKNLASTHADLDRTQQDIKRIKGDIDALKVGVTMGQLPGQETPPEGSVAAQLAEIKIRLEALESRVSDLASSGGVKKSDKKDSGSVNADADSLQKAFDRKHYKEVVQDSPAVLKKLKGKDRERVLSMYGESLMKNGKHKEAALQFNEILESKPSDKMAPYAKLKVAECFKAMGDKETSKLFYEEVIAKYPDSPEAVKAKKAIGNKKS